MDTKQAAAVWGISERSVRNYCAQGRLKGAVRSNKGWLIPKGAEKPKRVNERPQGRPLLSALREEKKHHIKGGIYHKMQIELTYNSNHIEGSTLTQDQTRYIFETNTLGADGTQANVDDIMETANHFRCIDFIIENANRKLTERFIKELHKILKSGTSDSRLEWFEVGDYKKLPNEVGGHKTTAPENVSDDVAALIGQYEKKPDKTLDDLLDFHWRLERIHPFQDGNGRVGRLVLFKECLRHGIVPFIISDELKLFYYRGLSEWKNERGYLRDTCLTAQDSFKEILDYFKIDYSN